MLKATSRFAALALAVAFVTPAIAAEDLEEIIVTGSYIKGTPQDAASPVQVLDRDYIKDAGVSDMAELMRRLEVMRGSDTAPSDGGRFNGRSGSGLANVNLRGLGPTATLVLVDGKRMPYAGQKLADGDRFVDINAIPKTMVQRV
jgi:iron complex outermembrane receptor protein